MLFKLPVDDGWMGGCDFDCIRESEPWLNQRIIQMKNPKLIFCTPRNSHTFDSTIVIASHFSHSIVINEHRSDSPGIAIIDR